MAEIPTHGCNRPHCTVAADGKCLEGLEPSECNDHYFVSDSTDESHSQDSEGSKAENAVEDLDESEVEETVLLFLGEELDASGAHTIMRASRTHLIVIAGEQKSGKTTLLASIYDFFQEKPYAGYLFAGSLTQPALDRRCFLARTASGRVHADTERTKPKDGPDFLHLAVRVQDLTQPIQHLLLSDISGEIFERASTSTAEVRKLWALTRADHFVLLFDGERLIDPVEKYQAKEGNMELLRNCLDSNMLGRHTYVDAVISKWDLVEGHLEKNNTQEFIEGIFEDLNKRYKHRLGQLNVYRIAARVSDPDSVISIGYGIEPLFRRWVIESPRQVRRKPFEPEQREDDREFIRFYWRHLVSNSS